MARPRVKRRIVDRHITHFGTLQEKFGDWLYYRILGGNKLLSVVRGRLGLRYWSLSEFLKRQSGAAERFIDRFVQAGLDDARRRGLDGIVCGHIHRAALFQRQGLVYANDGDWVESLSVLVEETDGRLRLLAHTGEVLCSKFPVEEVVEHGFDVFLALVLVVEVVGVFPDIDRQ